MGVQARQIHEASCPVDMIAFEDVLRRLSPAALRELGLPPHPDAYPPDAGAYGPAKRSSLAAPNPDSAVGRLIGTAIERCLRAYEPKGAYKVFNPAICTLPPKYTEPAIKLVGTMMVFHGQDVYEKLRRAAHCALMVATTGEPKSETIPSNASALDRELANACALALANAAADRLNLEIVRTAMDEDLSTDDRLCPGEGDFPIETRSQIAFYTQAEKRLGITIDEQGDSHRSFSVFGAVGLFDPTQKSRRRACGRCRYRTFCTIRAIGMSCHGRKGSFKK